MGGWATPQLQEWVFRCQLSVVCWIIRRPTLSPRTARMPRETIRSGEQPPEPGEELPKSAASLARLRDDEIALRPRHMSEMVGQQKVAERLAIAVDAARKRNEPLGHILLDGPPGLGKTTFATCIPRDL